MTQAQSSAGPNPEDISLDAEGRVVIANPQVLERLRAAVEDVTVEPAATTVNNGCNTVRQCGCVTK